MDVDDTPTRVKDLWFSDGSLVIQADKSLYRVPRSILAARSTVFNDMQSFPQPVEDGETIEGCPVVKLPDAAADVTCFLRAIFDSSYFETYPTKTDLSTVGSILHLSNKYGVDYLRRRALVHLSSGIPMTYSEDDEESSISDVPDGRDDGPAILAIRIARETQALWVLPWLFYIIAETESNEIRKILAGSSYGTHFAQLRRPNLIPQKQLTNICCDKRCDILPTLSRTCYQFLKNAHQEAAQALWDELPEICELPPWEDLKKMKDQALKA
ncbi:hypothetical protein B0H19DRAFT_1062380 [Mycena capillaripes]|nr:hypothetical protein B0H19DRAFT_1062380 [Mycena capillaripes]